MLPNLVKYCVDCFSLLLSVLVRVGYISGCICLQFGGFLSEVVVEGAGATSGIRASQVHREIVC